MSRAKFQKDLSFLRAWILGKEWWLAHDALQFGLAKHDGLRKDGVTPEFHHQVQMALLARTLVPWMDFPEHTVAAVFLHDVPEDMDDVGHEDIEERFGLQISVAVERMTKKYRGSEKPYSRYFSEMEVDPIASIGKGIDRCHNVSTMIGVFSPEKKARYINEIDEYFLPMLKAARRNFPQQEPAYQNIAHHLRTMRDIYRWALVQERNMLTKDQVYTLRSCTGFSYEDVLKVEHAGQEHGLTVLEAVGYVRSASFAYNIPDPDRRLEWDMKNARAWAEGVREKEGLEDQFEPLIHLEREVDEHALNQGMEL